MLRFYLGSYPVEVAVLTVNQLLNGSGGSTPSLPIQNNNKGGTCAWDVRQK